MITKQRIIVIWQYLLLGMLFIAPLLTNFQGECNYPLFNFQGQSLLKLVESTLIIISTVGLLISLILSLFETFSLANYLLSLSLSVFGITLFAFNHASSLVLLLIELLHVHLFFDVTFISSKCLFALFVIFANFINQSSIYDILIQMLVMYMTYIEKVQQRSLNQAYFKVIEGFKEDIQNNTNYVAGVVHDLRNPLTEINTCAELLAQIYQEQQLTIEMAQLIQAFRRNSENLISMVNNILDYAKIKNKKLELDLQPTNIRDFLNKIIDMHSVKAAQKNLKLDLKIEDDQLPERLYFDQSRLTNILVNLTSNAIKFTNKGGVSLRVQWFPDNPPPHYHQAFNNDDVRIEEFLRIEGLDNLSALGREDSKLDLSPQRRTTAVPRPIGGQLQNLMVNGLRRPSCQQLRPNYNSGGFGDQLMASKFRNTVKSGGGPPLLGQFDGSHQIVDDNGFMANQRLLKESSDFNLPLLQHQQSYVSSVNQGATSQLILPQTLTNNNSTSQQLKHNNSYLFQPQTTLEQPIIIEQEEKEEDEEIHYNEDQDLVDHLLDPNLTPENSMNVRDIQSKRRRSSRIHNTYNVLNQLKDKQSNANSNQGSKNIIAQQVEQKESSKQLGDQEVPISMGKIEAASHISSLTRNRGQNLMLDDSVSNDDDINKAVGNKFQLQLQQVMDSSSESFAGPARFGEKDVEEEAIIMMPRSKSEMSIQDEDVMISDVKDFFTEDTKNCASRILHTTQNITTLHRELSTPASRNRQRIGQQNGHMRTSKHLDKRLQISGDSFLTEFHPEESKAGETNQHISQRHLQARVSSNFNKGNQGLKEVSLSMMGSQFSAGAFLQNQQSQLLLLRESSNHLLPSSAPGSKPGLPGIGLQKEQRSISLQKAHHVLHHNSSPKSISQIKAANTVVSNHNNSHLGDDNSQQQQMRPGLLVSATYNANLMPGISLISGGGASPLNSNMTYISKETPTLNGLERQSIINQSMDKKATPAEIQTLLESRQDIMLAQQNALSSHNQSSGQFGQAEHIKKLRNNTTFKVTGDNSPLVNQQLQQFLSYNPVDPNIFGGDREPSSAQTSKHSGNFVETPKIDIFPSTTSPLIKLHQIDEIVAVDEVNEEDAKSSLTGKDFHSLRANAQDIKDSSQDEEQSQRVSSKKEEGRDGGGPNISTSYSNVQLPYRLDNSLAQSQHLNESISRGCYNNANSNFNNNMNASIGRQHSTFRPRPFSITANKSPTQSSQSRETSGTIMIQVVDTGIGIPAQFKSRLFQPFGQANKEIQKNFGGTGLGLWISKMIVEIMGGSISLDSEEKQGTCFTIKLKMRTARPEQVSLLSSQDQLKKTMTLLSHTNSIQSMNTQAMKKIILLSDHFTTRIIKGYIEPLTFSVKQIIKPSELIPLMQEQTRRCIFFDEEYKTQVLKYIKEYKKSRQFILVALKQQVPELKKSGSRRKIAGIKNMNADCSIDYIIRKPVQKAEFNEVFNKILLQMHLQMHQVSVSMNEMAFPTNEQLLLQGGVIGDYYINQSFRQNEIQRSTSAFINHNGLSSFVRNSGSVIDSSQRGSSPDNLRKTSVTTATAMNLIKNASVKSLKNQQSLFFHQHNNSKREAATGQNGMLSTPVLQLQPSSSIVQYSNNGGGGNFGHFVQIGTLGGISMLDPVSPISQHHIQMQQSGAHLAFQQHQPHQHNMSSLHFGNANTSTTPLLQRQPSHMPNKSKLLIVDDQEFILNAMTQMLDKIRQTSMLRTNFDIISAKNGEDALSIYQQHQTAIKLVLLDIQMPIMDGYECAQKIREIEDQQEEGSSHNKVHIVALSGDDSFDHVRRCRLVEINEMLTKPVSRSQLEQVITSIFG